MRERVEGLELQLRGVEVERSQLGESLSRERQQISDLQSYIILLKQ